MPVDAVGDFPTRQPAELTRTAGFGQEQMLANGPKMNVAD